MQKNSSSGPIVPSISISTTTVSIFNFDTNSATLLTSKLRRRRMPLLGHRKFAKVLSMCDVICFLFISKTSTFLVQHEKFIGVFSTNVQGKLY